MADADLLPQLLRQLTQKENAPPPDDNTQINKSIVPNDFVQMDDSALTVTKYSTSSFKWSGNVNGTYMAGGWKWNQGEYKPIAQNKKVYPNDSMQMDDTNGLTMTMRNPSTFKWGGNVNGKYQLPGWKWNQGQYAQK